MTPSTPRSLYEKEIHTAGTLFPGTMIIGDRRARTELYRRFHIN